jgi:hypothetical protein
MKKTARKRRRNVNDLRPEYRFDYADAKPNRFAGAMKQPVLAVVLESDVAAVFDSAEKVNAQLRSAISRRKRRQPVVRTRTHHRRAS